MIEIVKGDLLEEGPPLICQQVNCKGVMGKGLAKSIKEKYPEVYEEYRAMCWNKTAHSDTKKLLGQVQVIPTEDNKRFVANLFGQNNYGTGRVFTNLEALRHSFQLLKAMCLHNMCDHPYLNEIGIPFGIGCGLGGETWEKVFSMLVDEFGDEEKITLIIYNKN